MINFFSIEFFAGAILGIVISFLAVNFFKKSKNSEGDFAKELENLKNEIKNYQDSNQKERGSVSQILEDMRLTEKNFVDEAKKIRNTLISGGNQKQGAWGEMVLKHILKDRLGFTEGEEFETKGIETEDGVKIPDVIVHFPDGRDVLIDSKVSLTAWDEYINATDNATQADAKKRHIISIKNHISSLEKKHYSKIKGVNSLDTVIMFVAIEPSVSSLGNDSREIMDFALSKKITLVGPAMLYFALKTVENLWKTEKQSKNILEVIEIANKVSSQAVEIYESAAEAKKTMAKSTEGIDKVLDKIKDGRGSMIGRIEKMNQVGGLSPKKSIPLNIKGEVSDE